MIYKLIFLMKGYIFYNNLTGNFVDNNENSNESTNTNTIQEKKKRNEEYLFFDEADLSLLGPESLNFLGQTEGEHNEIESNV